MTKRSGFLGISVIAALATVHVVAAVDRAESDRLASVLKIKEGMRIGDVGAGRGDWSLELAGRVGPTGHVFATEVDPDRLKDLHDRVSEGKLTNVSVVRGDQKDTGLSAECCDALLVREVYHHFTDPAAMRSSLSRAVRPGGLIAIVDFEPGSHGLSRPSGIPENRNGHGITRTLLIDEMVEAGFEVESEHPDWPDRSYCVVFRRPASL